MKDDLGDVALRLAQRAEEAEARVQDLEKRIEILMSERGQVQLAVGVPISGGIVPPRDTGHTLQMLVILEIASGHEDGQQMMRNRAAALVDGLALAATDERTKEGLSRAAALILQLETEPQAARLLKRLGWDFTIK